MSNFTKNNNTSGYFFEFFLTHSVCEGMHTGKCKILAVDKAFSHVHVKRLVLKFSLSFLSPYYGFLMIYKPKHNSTEQM